MAPSGVLCAGKAQGESWLSPKPPLLPCAAALPERELPAAAGAPLPSWGAVFPHPAAPAASPRLTPAACPPTAPSAPGSCRKRGEPASGPAAPQPVGRGGRLRSPAPWGRTPERDEAPWGRTEALPEPWLPVSCQSSCFRPPLLGTQRGCGTCPCPHPSLPACCLLPAQALHAGQRPFSRWRGRAWERLPPGRGTHGKVATQEPLGQTRRMEVLSSSPPSSSSSSPAASFPPLSTHSWSRARQSCGRRVVPRLQRGEAGGELEVASLGSSQAEPCLPPAVGTDIGASSTNVPGLGLVPGHPCHGPRARYAGKAAGL